MLSLPVVPVVPGQKPTHRTLHRAQHCPIKRARDKASTQALSLALGRS